MNGNASKKKWNMSIVIIGTIVVLFLIFGVLATIFGYLGFTDAFKAEFTETTYRMADTATVLVNGDLFNDYLNGERLDDYARSKNNLDIYCKKIHVTMMYVIVVDTTDYGRFVCVMESIDNSVENTDYVEWERGHKRDTTNDEYREKYRAIYEEGSAYESVFRYDPGDGQRAHITTMMPVKDSEGRVAGILCVHRMMNEIEGVIGNYMFRVGLTSIGMAIIAAVVYAILVGRYFIRPIRRVSAEATRFAKESTKSEPLGEISRFSDISNLATSIDTMETDMLAYVDDLTAATTEKERLAAELSVASAIQETSIPNVFPPFPDRKEFDIYASMTPAKEVGGDFYNFFLIDDDHLAFVIGDVSGKGIPASLFMMATNILISDRALMGGTPAEILSYVNERICERNQVDMFVTLWLGIFEISTGKISAANAGHDDAVVIRKDGRVEQIKTKHGLVVGAMSTVKYHDFEITLEKGDKIFIYTDGVPEATDTNGNLFTMARMLQSLEGGHTGTPRDVLDSVNRSVNAFVGDAPQFDDLTMLCLERKEDETLGRALTVDAKQENLGEVTAFAEAFLEENDCPPKALVQLGIVIDEVFSNIASYAYEGGEGKAEIRIFKTDDEITLVFTDEGIAFDPLAKEDPDVTLSAEDRPIGGLGIFIVKKSMDDVSYKRENGKNMLTIKKKL